MGFLVWAVDLQNSEEIQNIFPGQACTHKGPQLYQPVTQEEDHRYDEVGVCPTYSTQYFRGLKVDDGQSIPNT